MKLFKIRRISRLLAALCLITTLMLSFDCTWTEASQTPDEDAKPYETLVPGTFAKILQKHYACRGLTGVIC